MARFAMVVLSLLLLVTVASYAQSPGTSPSVVRDPQAVSLLQKSLAAMTNGVTVSDVTLSGTANRFAGSDQEAGSVLLEAKGNEESKVALTLTNYTYTELRTFQDGASVGSYTGPDGVTHTTALHNCFTDSSWFFPPLSSIAVAVNNPGLNASYVGQETVDGVSVQHVQVWQSVSSPDAAAVKTIAHLSAVDWYLDPTSALPLVARFTTHPNENASADLQVEIRFATYQGVNGVLLPFHVQKLLNGGLLLDLTISSALLNTGLPDTNF